MQAVGNFVSPVQLTESDEAVRWVPADCNGKDLCLDLTADKDSERNLRPSKNFLALRLSDPKS